MHRFHQARYSKINPAKIRRAYDKLQVLNNRATRRIIMVMEGAERPMTVREIEMNTDMPQSQVSSTLARLRRHGYVDFEQEGKYRHYYLVREEFHRVGAIMHTLSSNWE